MCMRSLVVMIFFKHIGSMLFVCSIVDVKLDHLQTDIVPNADDFVALEIQ